MTDSAIEHDTAVEQLEQLLDRRRLDSARDVLAKVLPLFPDSPQLLQYSAWVDWMEDRLDEALETIERVLEIDPNAYAARFLLTRIQIEQGRYPEAEATVISLLREYPDESELYAHYAHIMLNTFNLEKAERLAAEALRREPENESALNVHVLCGFIQSPGEEQRKRLQTLLREHPDQQQTTIRVVQMLIDDGKTREAYELTRELVLLDPSNTALVDLAQELRNSSHWSLIPLWPMQKFGWGGAIGLWFVFIVLLRSKLFEGTAFGAFQPALGVFLLVYVVYSWVWPPLLARLLK